jgi:hypothetical protein
VNQTGKAREDKADCSGTNFSLRRFRTVPTYSHEKDHLELLVSGARSRTSFSQTDRIGALLQKF